MSHEKQPSPESRSLRRLTLAGLAVIATTAGGFGAWAALAPLSGAVIASGQIAVDGQAKRIQHPTGGVIADILVRDGQTVEAGQVLVRLDETMTRASLGMIASQIDELTVRRARLEAERAGATELAFPADLLARASRGALAETVAGEQSLFEARRSAREGRKEQLRERIAQFEEEVQGLSAQRDAKDRELALVTEELTGVERLHRQNLVTSSRFLALQREAARIGGERGQLTADIARIRGRIAEVALQISQVDQDERAEVMRELRDVQGRLAELGERRVAAQEQLARVEIRSPVAGVVDQLAVHSIDGVVKPGDTLMQVMPRGAGLVVEVRVAPGEIDRITPGGEARVKLRAGSQSTTPELTGTVGHISTDAVRERESGAPFYVVRITLPESEVARLGGLRLVPGMPAEAFVTSGTRTAFGYLTEPLTQQVARAFRER